MKQPRYGEFCKSMLTDPYEEIKQEKFWNEKKFIETHYSTSLSKTIAGCFSKLCPLFEMHSSIHRRERIEELTGSWHPSQKDLCQCWIVCFSKHSSPYASRSKAHLSPMSFPNQIQKLIAPVVWNYCPFFSVSYTDQHTRGFT